MYLLNAYSIDSKSKQSQQRRVIQKHGSEFASACFRVAESRENEGRACAVVQVFHELNGVLVDAIHLSFDRDDRSLEEQALNILKNREGFESATIEGE